MGGGDGRPGLPIASQRPWRLLPTVRSLAPPRGSSAGFHRSPLPAGLRFQLQLLCPEPPFCTQSSGLALCSSLSTFLLSLRRFSSYGHFYFVSSIYCLFPPILPPNFPVPDSIPNISQAPSSPLRFSPGLQSDFFALRPPPPGTFLSHALFHLFPNSFLSVSSPTQAEATPPPNRSWMHLFSQC